MFLIGNLNFALVCCMPWLIMISWLVADYTRMHLIDRVSIELTANNTKVSAIVGWYRVRANMWTSIWSHECGATTQWNNIVPWILFDARGKWQANAVLRLRQKWSISSLMCVRVAELSCALMPIEAITEYICETNPSRLALDARCGCTVDRSNMLKMTCVCTDHSCVGLGLSFIAKRWRYMFLCAYNGGGHDQRL